jgi:hypothetical protein
MHRDHSHARDRGRCSLYRCHFAGEQSPCTRPARPCRSQCDCRALQSGCPVLVSVPQRTGNWWRNSRAILSTGTRQTRMFHGLFGAFAPRRNRRRAAVPTGTKSGTFVHGPLRLTCPSRSEQNSRLLQYRPCEVSRRLRRHGGDRMILRWSAIVIALIVLLELAIIMSVRSDEPRECGAVDSCKWMSGYPG